jgi:N6-adenosine-specific RNA methylase IME4
MRKHKYNIFPEASADDYNRLRDDIKANGFDLNQPITIYQGEILDGWNRTRACNELGITPPVTQFVGSDADAIAFVLRTNKRRNLNPGQWACIAAEADELLAAIREQVERERREKIAENNGKKQKETTRQLIAESSDDQKTTAKAAALFNTNRTYVNDAVKLKESAPDMFEKVKSGQTTMTQAKREIKESKREQRREENRAKVASVTTPEKIVEVGAKFATIVIDPPWDWGDEGDQDQLGRARPDYATMTKAQLLDLPLPELADDDCHIYLWITNRSLPKGFELLEKWGFRYVTAITWAKPHFGMGNYFRGQTEHVLFGVKGSQALKRKDVGTLFQADRGKGGHSSKPPEFYDLVESCSPGPYLEMFSRSEKEGWKTWGENA